eukprot:44152-Karenia_brevis.AAC.1
MYVDDITVRLISTMQQVVKILPAATRWFITFVEDALGLVVSRGVQGKSSYMGSVREVQEALKEPMAEQGLQLSHSVRWLGVDYQGGGGCKKKSVRQA